MSPVFDVPRLRSRSVIRPRLLDSLNVEDARARLTIVHGPAGDGKTTLLTQWSESRSWEHENLVWVTLYPDNQGVLPFWTRIAETLVRAGVVPSDFELGVPAGDFTTMLVGSFSTLEHPLTLLLDDYHLVVDEHIDAQLRLLLDRIPGLSLVLGTRTTGDLHSIELAARLGTVYIDAAALAFTAEESDELVQKSGLASIAGLGRAIHDATDGWPLASQALIIEAQRDSASPLLQHVTADGSVFAREFARSTLASLAEEVRLFLMRLSLADESTVKSASDLTGQSPGRTAQLLGVLERDGVGMWQSRSGVEWFRVHPLLREALEEVALSTLDASSIRAARVALSDQLAQVRPVRALELAILAKDWERTEQLILHRFVTFTYYNRVAFDELLGKISTPVARAHPGILNAQLVQDYNVQTGKRDRFVRRHGLSTSIAVRNIEPTVTSALREFSFSGMNRQYGDLTRAVAHVERSQAALAASEYADVAENAHSLPILYAHNALTRYFDRQTLRALDEMRFANDATTQSGSAGERLLSLGLMAFMHALQGDLIEANVWIDRGDAADPYDGWVGGYLQTPHLVARALSSVNKWRSEPATVTLDLLKFTEPANEFWPWILYVRAAADAINVGPAAAQAALESALARAEQRPIHVPSARALLTATQAQLLMLSGQPRRAQKLVDESGLAGEPEVDLVRARMASLSRKDARAIELAVSVVWRSGASVALRADALLTLASCAYNAGQAVRAADAFTEAIVALERSGLRLPLLWLGPARIGQLASLAKGQGAVLDETIWAGVPDIVAHARRILPLTPSELRVLSSLNLNTSVSETAAALFLSTNTVRFHLKQVYKKLGVTGRAEAIALSHELGLLERAP